MIVRVQFSESLPLHALADYISNIEDIYYKFFLLDRLIDRLSAGFQNFRVDRKRKYLDYLRSSQSGTGYGVAADSLISVRQIQAFSEVDLDALRKPAPPRPKDEISFSVIASTISRQMHPRVSWYDGNRFLELVDDDDPANLLVRELVVNSPPIISFEGLDSVLKQLFYGKNEELRRQDEHEFKTMRSSLEIGAYMIHLDERLNDANISTETRNYIRELLSTVREKQRRVIDVKDFKKIDFLA